MNSLVHARISWKDLSYNKIIFFLVLYCISAIDIASIVLENIDIIPLNLHLLHALVEKLLGAHGVLRIHGVIPSWLRYG